MSAVSSATALAPLSRRRVIEGLDRQTRIDLAALEVLARVGSTNERLLRRSPIPSGGLIACLAEEQTAGRGRRGRPWRSPPASSLYMSLAVGLDPHQPVPGTLSLELGIAVVDTLRRLGAEGLGLKWPNDLHAAGAKLGGLLIESRRSGLGRGILVAGLGINLSWRPADGRSIDQPWTELAAVCPSGLPERNALAAALIDAMWIVLKGPGAIPSKGLPERFAALDVLGGREVVLDTPCGALCGRARGIGNHGALRVEIDGHTREFPAAEVSVRPAR